MSNGPRSRARARASAAACAGLVLACGAESSDAPDGATTEDASPSSSPCTSHAECVDLHDEHWICREDETCVSLLSPACTLVRGDDTNERAVFVGVLSVEGGPLFGASDLARDDFADVVGGVPGEDGSGTRPLVLVGCTYPAGTDPVPAARHLAEEIRVPAIVGTQGSETVINVAQNVTIPAGVLLISPLAQSDLVGDLHDRDLVFRTSPSGESAAAQLAAMLADLETTARSERGLTHVRVALVSPRDAYGLSVSAATLPRLRFNEGLTADENERDGRFLQLTYDATAEHFEREVAQRVVELGADIVLSLSPAEQRVFTKIEQTWPADAGEPPFYIITGFSGDSRKFVAARPDSLRARIRFANPLDPTRPLYQRYQQRVENEFGSSTALLAVPGAYDATYVVAYGIAAARDAPLTGAAIARGIRRLTGPGKTISVRPDQIARGIALLEAGDNIDLEGVSGALDFDERGDVTTDGSVDCLVRDRSSGEIGFAFAGQTFDSGTNRIVGTFECD